MCSLHEDFCFAVDLILIILDNILVDFLRFREMNIIISHNRNEMIKMIKSMTGFGRFEGTAGGRTISVEIKTVNHRFLDFTCKTNRGYGFLEERLKGFISDYIARGKVDVFVGEYILLNETSCVVPPVISNFFSSVSSILPAVSPNRWVFG